MNALLRPFIAPLLLSMAPTGEVNVFKDIAYHDGKGADPVRHKLDLYLPKGAKEFPVVVFLHGGSWKNGSKENLQALGRTFAANGVGTVVPNYRLTPQVKHPEHIHDVERAYAWTYKHIGRYGGSRDKLFIGGYSAGGHLAALLATDGSYLKAQEIPLTSVKGAIAISAAYQLILADHKVFGEVFGNEEMCQQASPLHHVKGRHPPFLLLYAEKDFLNCVQITNAMVEALRKSKNEADFQMFKGRTHSSIMADISKQDDPVARAMLEFISKHAKAN